jgi:hypothetical protein
MRFYDPPEGWLAAAKGLQQPFTVVIADQSPPKSLAEMQALAAVADRVTDAGQTSLPLPVPSPG